MNAPTSDINLKTDRNKQIEDTCALSKSYPALNDSNAIKIDLFEKLDRSYRPSKYASTGNLRQEFEAYQLSLLSSRSILNSEEVTKNSEVKLETQKHIRRKPRNGTRIRQRMDSLDLRELLHVYNKS